MVALSLDERCYERSDGLMDTSFSFYLILSFIFCYLIIVALWWTLVVFVLFYAALRSRSLVLFLMLCTP